jgi:iron complex outermembrane recepter protein
LSLLFLGTRGFAQDDSGNFSLNNGLPLTIVIQDEQLRPLVRAMVELTAAGQPRQFGESNENGEIKFGAGIKHGYMLRIRHIGFVDWYKPLPQEAISLKFLRIVLEPEIKTIETATIIGKKDLVQRQQGKTVVNVDAAISNAGTTVLEVLEKSPGVMVDRNGTLSLMGKTGTLVLVDDKQTFLSGTDLNNLLSSMSSSQVEQIELITNPSARYDANGNAGIINIKTKKNKQKGLNGTLSTSYGQGVYHKNNNSLALNYRQGRFNTYLTYSSNFNGSFRDLYALREFFDDQQRSLFKLDQPWYFINNSANNTLKTGLDYSLSAKTSLGFALSGSLIERNGKGRAQANWLSTQGVLDSSIKTTSVNTSHFQNGGINLYAKHSFNPRKQISIDFDRLGYDIENSLRFDHNSVQNNSSIVNQGDLPSLLDITTFKIDYQQGAGKDGMLELGYKMSSIDTDNSAEYQIGDGTSFRPDYNKSNRFLYGENIHAWYSSFDQKIDKLSLQLGLRYERTSFDAQQLGNVERADSSFSRQYQGFFPTAFFSYQADTVHTFTFSAGRRLDRPPFQRLNPFVNIINKYTYEQGNPFFRPQFTWNFEVGHQFRRWLNTTLSYSLIRDYFSQLFLTNGEGIQIYTQGNVGRMYNLGLAVSVQANPTKWWTLNAQGIFNHKVFKGFENSNYSSQVGQLNFSMNSQFKLGKTYSAEVSGFYTTRSRNDIQELVYDSGQLSLGIARPVLNKQGTLKLSIRDLFHTQLMEGLTDFPNAEEYFIQYWDTRVLSLAFSYRFGQQFKSARRNGAAGEEVERVGN